jgi:hypothetical protein
MPIVNRPEFRLLFVDSMNKSILHGLVLSLWFFLILGAAYVISWVLALDPDLSLPERIIMYSSVLFIYPFGYLLKSMGEIGLLIGSLLNCFAWGYGIIYIISKFKKHRLTLIRPPDVNRKK